MTDEAKALELTRRGSFCEVNVQNMQILAEAFRYLHEQHEQFKRDVSDAIDSSVLTPETEAHLSRFILPKPVDQLVAVMDDFMSMDGGCLEECVEQFRAALAKRGLQISEGQPC